MKSRVGAFFCLSLLVVLVGCGDTPPPVSPSPARTQPPPTAPPTALPTAAPTLAPTVTPLPADLDSPLTGLPIDPELWQWPPLVAVVPSDSEQYGLSQASLVFEAVTEYDIPRYMAVFEQLEAERIGPIRSARPYYVDWACPYGSLFVHWGGSPQALSRLAELDCLRPLDGLTYGAAYFFSVPDEQVPWNDQFTTSAMLYRYLRNWEITRATVYRGYTHKLDAPMAQRPLTATLSFAFGQTVRYTYDQQDNVYLREYAGQPHLDLLTGEQHRVKNVVVLFAPTAPIPGDDQGRVEILTTGEGDALVFLDGRMVQGRWVKEAPEAEIRLSDETGQEIALNRGNIWIEVLGVGQEVSFGLGEAPE